MDEKKRGTRRRGQVLEEAIQLAAWRELLETGYTNMSMESVATRAGTNKSVLYRRWSDKSELVIAALRKYFFPKITNEIPNTGTLRGDVIAYLHERMGPLKTIGAETIRGLIMEPMVWRMVIASMPQIIQKPRSENKMTAAMAAILKNAELRGEIRLEKLTPRIVSLPPALLQYELMSKLEPVSDEAIEEIVDDIFLPLIRAAQQKPDTNRGHRAADH